MFCKHFRQHPKNMKTYNTWLPCFCGFYESPLSARIEVDYFFDNINSKKTRDILQDILYGVFDNEEYEVDVVKSICDFAEDFLKKIILV